MFVFIITLILLQLFKNYSILSILSKISYLKENSVEFFKLNQKKIYSLIQKWVLDIKILYLYLAQYGKQDLLSLERY
jgi:hypothetical protein